MKMTPVIAIANQKGGVGKTTSTVNLAHALIAKGKRVLVIDVDPQASLTICYGKDPRELDAAGKTLGHCLLKEKPLEEIIQQGPPDLVGSSINLASLEQDLARDYEPTAALRLKLEPIRTSGRYDFILLDCPPTLTLLTVNALASANSIVIPVKTDFLSIMGIPELLRTVDKIRSRINTQLRVFGILPTMYNSRNTHDNDALKELAKVLPQSIQMFEPVNRSTFFDKSAVERVAALGRYPDTPGVENYQFVGDKLIETHAS